jgi:hypothetical protein
MKRRLYFRRTLTVLGVEMIANYAEESGVSTKHFVSELN